MKSLEMLKIQPIDFKKMVKDGNKKLYRTIITQKIGHKTITYTIHVPVYRQENPYKEAREFAALFGETVLEIAKQLAAAPKSRNKPESTNPAPDQPARRGLFHKSK